MARVNHKRVKQLLNEKRSRITDRQFFTSRILAGHFEDMAMAQTRRYKYNRRIHVAISWSPKSGEVACTNNLSVLINAGHRLVTQNRGRENRYEIVCGLFAHELGHCLYTDFLAGQTYNNYLSREKWYPEPPAYKLPKDTVNERALWEYVRLESRNNEMLRYVAHHISNVIEDAYIENRILAQFRGTLGNCLEALREQQYESIPTVTELNVSHGKLLKQLWTIGIQDKKLISIISAMLKGEIAEIGFPEKGTAQGSIISPLLSNVVLNELDWWIASQWEFMPTRHVYKEAIKANGTQSKSKKYRALRNSTLKECFIVRYADDFKIFCRKHKDAVVMFEATKQWLKTRLGLDISPEKSKIVNLKHSYSEFLGFRIKVHKKGKDTKCKPPVDKYVVKSHISEKALKKIKTNAKERIIAIQKTNGSRAGEYAIRDYNSFVMGMQNYYSMATCVNPDIQTLAYEIKTSIKIRLNTRVKRRTNEALTPYLSERYGKSKELRFINGVPLVPIGYVQHRVPLHKKAVVNKYTAEGRKEIHKQLETVDIERVHELMRNPISNETVEFNDNCVSLFVAQRGKCAICKLPLTLENMRCVRKIPKSCGGDDKYNNLIIVHKEMERLIKSQDNKEIKRILNKYKLESNQRRKVNTIRKNAGLEEIDVKALDKEL